MVNMTLGNGKRHMHERYVIFAPHVDDEVIGCYRFLNSHKVEAVYYFCELSVERRNEAVACANKYGFKPVFATTDTLIVDPDVIILAPNINDKHPQHNAINRLAKKFPNKKKYYSVDMNVKFDVLESSEQSDKKSSLLSLFPSQAALFADEKYFLFESLIDDDSKKMIWVTFQRKGLHRYPQAATAPELNDVSYLGNEHRHLFKFKVSIEVNHADREIEFHQFLNWLESLYDGTLSLDYRSCEMISDELADAIRKEYSDRKLIIDISEDGECGCTCEYMI
jgi:hypothetical protein